MPASLESQEPDLLGDRHHIAPHPLADSLVSLPVFQFPQSDDLRLWVLPFCLKTKRLLLPEFGGVDVFFC